MDVARRYDAQSQVGRNALERIRQRQISPDAIALDLYEKALRTEHRFAVCCEIARGVQPILLELSRHQPIATRSREDDQPVLSLRKRRDGQPWIEPLGAQMGLGEQAAEIRVSRRALGEDYDMRAVAERDFGTGDGLHAERLGGV